MQEALQIRGITQADLCRKTGIATSTMSQYMTDKYEPKRNALGKIAKALNVDEAWLMGCEDVSMDRQEITDPLQSLSDGEKSVIETLRSMTKEKQDLIITLLGNLQDD